MVAARSFRKDTRLDRAMAAPDRPFYDGACVCVPICPLSGTAQVALGQLGCGVGRDPMDYSLRAILVLRGQLLILRQELRLPGRSRAAYDVALRVGVRHSDQRRARR